MSQPLRENLELIIDDKGAQWVCCTQCGTRLTQSPQTWREAAKTLIMPATSAGPLMAVLADQYDLQQTLCPSCGALLDTDLVDRPAPTT